MQSGKKSKKKILVICPHPVGVVPGQRLKYEQYFSYLEENNIVVHVSPFISRRFQYILYKKGYLLEKFFWTFIGYFRRITDLFRLPVYDAIYIFLYVTPFGPPIFESLFYALNPKIIYDIDDMVFLKPASNANKIVSRIKSKSKMIFLMKRASHVVVCTPSLFEIAHNYNEHVSDISSTINTDTYTVVNDYSNTRKLTIGWSGSHSTSQYLKLLEKVFEKLKGKYDFNILVIGDMSFSFTNIPCEVQAWSEDTEILNLQRIDIGVYPLPIEDPWVLGKSGLKALQYMALGLPTVASAVGANFRVIEDGVSGFLVRTEDEWVDRLEKLIQNPALRKIIGTQARNKVVEEFSIKSNRDTYLNIINNVIDQK